MKSILTLIKKVYGGLSREVWLLAITQLINRSGTMVVFFLSVYLTMKLGFTPQRAGVVMACFSLGSFLGTYLGGKLSDRYGPSIVMKWSMLIGGLLFIGVSFIENFYLLCLGMFLLTTCADAFRPANMAAISLYSTPETYTRSMSLNRLAINLGFSVGPVIGSILADHSYSYIFWADGATCIAAAVLVTLFLVRRKANANREKPITDEQPLSVWLDRHYLHFMLLVVFYVMAFFQFFSTMPLYYEGVEHLSKPEYGFLMMLNGLIVAVVELVMIYKIEKKMSPYNFIAIGGFLLVVSYALVYFFHGWWWMIVVTVIISFSEMLAMPFMAAIMNNRSSSTNKGQYASVYVMAWSTGQTLLPLIATQVMSRFGFGMLWIVLGAFAMVVTVGIKVVERRGAQ